MPFRSPLRTSRFPFVLAFAASLLLGGCSGNDQPVTPGPDCDGLNLLTFTSDRDQAPGQTDIYLYDLDLSAYRGLPGLNTTGPEHHATLAYDRRILAFVGSRGSGSEDILLYNRCTAILIPVPEIATASNEGDPAFSGDGKLLAFARDTTSGWRLRMFDGQALALVAMPELDSLASANGPYDDRHPTATAGAGLIAFSSNRNGNWDVFLYDRTRDSVLDIPELRSAGDDDDPWITPDGRFVVFASNRTGGAGGWDIYLFDVQSRTLIAVPNLNSASDERDPAIWKDGSLILFSSNRSGGPGRADLWSYGRGSQTLGPMLSSSPGDDLEPGLTSP